MGLSGLDRFKQRPHGSSFFKDAAAFLAALSPCDKLIAGVLAALLGALILVGLYTIERQFLVEVPSRGGSLTEGVVGHPRFVNPLLALSDVDRDLSLLTHAGLMGYDEHGHLVPVLAESYEVSEDGMIYTFVLREGIEFSDGTPVTAEDVVFTVEKAQDPGLKSPRLADWAGIVPEAVDARTIQFTLPKAYAPFLEDATLGILPAHIWREVTNEEFPFSTYMAQPIGAGPFEVKEVRRDKNGVIEKYVLQSFKGYALHEPYLSKISFVYFDDEEALQEAFSRGRVESAYGIPSADALRAPYSRIFGVFFNQSKDPALMRSEVREALSKAVDRTRLVNETLEGYATPAFGPVPPSLIEPLEVPVTSLEEARKLLTDGGWVFDETERVWKHEKEGLTLGVTITTGNVPELKAVADAVRRDWEALGVTVDIELYEASELVPSAIRPRAYEALLFGMVVGRDRDFFAFWDSSQRTDPGLNVAAYTNRAVDDVLDVIREETDPLLVAEALQELNTLVAADYPAVFTHSPDFIYSVPKTLYGVALGPVAAPSDRLITAPFWYRTTEEVWPFLVDGR